MSTAGSSQIKMHARAAVEAVEAEGIAVCDIRQGRKHYKLYCRAPDGRTKMFVTSVSPSDHRALYNTRAIVRRWLKEPVQ